MPSDNEKLVRATVDPGLKRWWEDEATRQNNSLSGLVGYFLKWWKERFLSPDRTTLVEILPSLPSLSQQELLELSVRCISEAQRKSSLPVNAIALFVKGWDIDELSSASMIPSERLLEISQQEFPQITAHELSGLVRAGIDKDLLKSIALQKKGVSNGKS